LQQYGSRYFNFEVMQMEKEDVVNSKTRPVAYITLNKDAASLSSFKLLAIWVKPKQIIKLLKLFFFFLGHDAQPKGAAKHEGV